MDIKIILMLLGLCCGNFTAYASQAARLGHDVQGAARQATALQGTVLSKNFQQQPHYSWLSYGKFAFGALAIALLFYGGYRLQAFFNKLFAEFNRDREIQAWTERREGVWMERRGDVQVGPEQIPSRAMLLELEESSTRCEKVIAIGKGKVIDPLLMVLPDALSRIILQYAWAYGLDKTSDGYIVIPNYISNIFFTPSAYPNATRVRILREGGLESEKYLEIVDLTVGHESHKDVQVSGNTVLKRSPLNKVDRYHGYNYCDMRGSFGPSSTGTQYWRDICDILKFEVDMVSASSTCLEETMKYDVGLLRGGCEILIDRSLGFAGLLKYLTGLSEQNSVVKEAYKTSKLPKALQTMVQKAAEGNGKCASMICLSG